MEDINVYKKPAPLGVNMRAMLEYAHTHGKKAADLTEAEVLEISRNTGMFENSENMNLLQSVDIKRPPVFCCIHYIRIHRCGVFYMQLLHNLTPFSSASRTAFCVKPAFVITAA